MEFMKKNGCNPNVFNYSALMNGFCKEGRLEEAKEVFDEMKSLGLKPDTVGYTTLINFFCRAGRVDEAMELLKDMIENKCRADTVTFNVILGGLCREGRFEEALGMLERLPYEGVYLNKASYRIVLNSLCREGELQKATQLVGLMLVMALLGLLELGFKPEPNSWALLVELICRERKLLPAFELLDDLVIQEPIKERKTNTNTVDVGARIRESGPPLSCPPAPTARQLSQGVIGVNLDYAPLNSQVKTELD
ncbi:Pentatricopeptide repeat-containing protein [Vitis vinifera]|uniref:Pentatricopeptide repeat-containing protein n=1 Tax=Vitis vinifera TaxID=29760 RepID=A0A438FZD4_VITVI|nr:Pentatricopeptide repeat-containing protein [Vitis vinifera]